MGLAKTFTSVAAAMICKQLTEKVVVGLPLTNLWGNTLEQCVSMAQNNFPGIVGDKWAWYPLRKQNSIPHHLSEIQSTALQGHPALTSAIEPIPVATMPGVGETFKSVIDDMTYGSNSKLINLCLTENTNLTHEDLNTSIDEPENQCNIHLVSYHTLTSRAKRSSNGQLSHC